MVAGVSLVPVALGLAGCDLVWNWTNRDALRRDVVALLDRHGVVAHDPACSMLGSTRTGACTLSAEPARLPGLVRGLRLTEAPAADRIAGDWEREGGCLAMAGSGAVRFRSERRAAELRLPFGSAFEYLLLYQARRGDDMCIQVSYAYG